MINGKWRRVHIGALAHSFRMPIFTTRPWFHYGFIMHMGQVHKVLKWAHSKGYPFRYIQVSPVEIG